ncbi:ATP-binding protein [Streptomyces sp. SID8352]|uniref:ATP-binding protein n=1 Tax=Streptomyces sp. SID8352 TaxID=2690338 RepID=UPI00136B42A4|nr:ATP-binding protein [Streptomyces sp. SID8352]MYU24417.1 ATP-binding protein [Streptomyces sp. SID8352]
MDPNTRGPEERRNGDGRPPRPPRDPLAADFGQPALVRTARLHTGDLLLTVNPVDGSEIEVCPPPARPGPPARRTAAERAEADRDAAPSAPAGTAASLLAPDARRDERERLVGLLARGRSVRLTGPEGSGRSSLLDLVAGDCADLAPDGVVRLSGFRRGAEDLLHDLFHAVHHAPGYHPDRDQLAAHVRDIGAVVVLDDLEFGGDALDGLLAATPECAFLLAAAPDVPAPSAAAAVEEVALTGLDRAAGAELLKRAAGRSLTDEEVTWAGDLWFESEGLPLRFVQAGALLRDRDRRRAGAAGDLGDAGEHQAPDEAGGAGELRSHEGEDAAGDARPGRDDAPRDAVADAPSGAAPAPPLPSVGEAAAPAPLLAAGLSEAARATLEFAVALGGEVPHQAHLPALVGDTHADAALGELTGCGLVTPVGSRHRLAAGVLGQLEDAGYAGTSADRALAAARHYTWWTGHPSVGPDRVRAEADAVLAALTALAALTPAAGAEAPETAGTGPSEPDGRADDEGVPAVRLARAAAPALAAGLHWSAWERALRAGAEASLRAGDVAGAAYFRHELGVLALCGGHLDRARAELEASIALRGALSDRRGAVAGRRALALVADRSGDTPGPLALEAGPAASTSAGFGTLALPGGPGAAGPGPAARRGPSGEEPFPAGAFGTGAFGAGPFGTEPEEPVTAVVPAPFPPLQPPSHFPSGGTRPVPRAEPGGARKGGGIKGFARRNLVAAGAAALLVAVLGTVVTLGATSDHDPTDPVDSVGTTPTATRDADEGEPDTGRSEDDGSTFVDAERTAGPSVPDPGTPTAPTGSPLPSDSVEPSDEATTPDPTDDGDGGATEGTGTGSPSGTPGSPTPTGTGPDPTTSPTGEPDPTATTATEEPPTDGTSTEAEPPVPPQTDTASGPVGAPATAVSPEPGPGSGSPGGAEDLLVTVPGRATDPMI